MQRADGSWLMDGLIPVPELKDRLDLKELPEEDRGRYNTLAGMVMLLLGPAAAHRPTRWTGKAGASRWSTSTASASTRCWCSAPARTKRTNMIISNLHRQPVALDRSQHRKLKIHQPQMDWSVAAG